ncbi:MAG: sporulation protein YtfJ [Hyphomicrobiales bacterium]|nr:sporulation protein YtfJ [Hyphomicrobiales bacterium]
MDDVERLLKGTVEELDKLLNARNVLGDPIERDGSTIIPLVSYGFGFGAGGGTDTKKSGTGAGTGAGGGIKPLGAIIFDKDGARVEAVKGAVSNVAEVIGDAAARVIDRKSQGQSPSKEDG